MIAVLKLYKDSLILEDKNFIVDDIEDYLQTLSDTITVSNFQYQKHALNLSIKVDLSQSYLDIKAANDYNYASITNQNSDGTGVNKTIYYFISSMNWGAQNTIRLELLCDTINSFRAGTDFTISNKSLINREHRDRFRVVNAATKTNTFTAATYCFDETGGVYYSDVLIKTGGSNLVVNSLTSNANTTSYTISGGTISVHVTNDDPFERITITANVTYTSTATAQRLIDPVSEGLQSVLFKKTEQDITEKIDMRWYLVYKNNTAIDPTEFNPQDAIDVLLYTDEPLPVKIYGSGLVDASDLGNGEYLEININTTNTAQYGEIQLDYYNTILTRNESIRIYEYEAQEQTMNQGAVIYKYNNVLYIRKFQASYINGSWVKVYSDAAIPDSNGISIDYQGVTNVYHGLFVGDPSQISTMLSIPYATTYNDAISNTSVTQYVDCDIKTLDRTDSTIIKVIMTPYCPVDFDIDGGFYVISKGWIVSGNLIKLQNRNADFENNIESNITSPISELYLKTLNPSNTDLRDDSNESKLLHSDFLMHKIVYDSFAYDIPLENIDETLNEFNKITPSLFQINWSTTNTIQSRFLAKFPQLTFKRSTQAFDNILYINRNNEMPIFTSPYFNYLRTGYNYDVKDKERTIAQADEALAFQAFNWGANTAAAGVSAIASSNPMGLVSTFVGGASSMLKSINDSAYLAMRLDSNIMRNLATTRATAISVSAADDVNLLLKYCKVAKCIKYEASDLFKQAMGDLFHYCGYARNIQGIPNMTSRYWWNFTSLQLKFATTNNIPDDMLVDIIGKYNEGVTQLHHHTTWNFDQDRENWEVGLL